MFNADYTNRHNNQLNVNVRSFDSKDNDQTEIEWAILCNVGAIITSTHNLYLSAKIRKLGKHVQTPFLYKSGVQWGRLIMEIFP